MDKPSLQEVKDVYTYPADNKHACMICGKPLRTLYEVADAEGTVLLLCGSDMDRQLKVALAKRDQQRAAAADFATNGTARIS